jgi:hypothetical protein
MRVLEKTIQESNSPFVGDDPVDYSKWGVPAREEEKDPSGGFQNVRSIPNEFLRIWHVFDEIAGGNSIEGFGPKWEVNGEICNHGVFNVRIFDYIAGK